MAESSPKGQNTLWERWNCSSQAISPFPTVFSKDLYCRHVKSRACLGKGWQIGQVMRYDKICLIQQKCHLSRDSSVGRAEDCRGKSKTSLGRWFESGSRDIFFGVFFFSNSIWSRHFFLRFLFWFYFSKVTHTCNCFLFFFILSIGNFSNSKYLAEKIRQSDSNDNNDVGYWAFLGRPM